MTQDNKGNIDTDDFTDLFVSNLESFTDKQLDRIEAFACMELQNRQRQGYQIEDAQAQKDIDLGGC